MGLLVAGCALALALTAGDALGGQLPVSLGAAGSYAALAGSTVTSTGLTTLGGDLGVGPGTSLTGFPPGVVTGKVHAGDPFAMAAQGDLTAAYNDAAGRQPPQALPADVGGETLAPGVYKTGATPALGVTGTLTLDGRGDPKAVFVFQVGSALTTAVSSHVNLIGGAQAGNVFWQVGSSATLGTSSTFAGSILALTSISINSGVTLDGRALARNGAVTMIADTINVPTASGRRPPPPRLHCRSGGRRTGKTHLTLTMAAATAIVRLKATGAAGANGPDTDGDGLPDSWETKGVDTNGDGKIDLNLRKMGADPCHKDLFVELDAMSGHAIQDAAVMQVVSAFNRAPVSNPDGKPGIHLHVDNGPRSVMNPVTGQRWGRLSESEHGLKHQNSLQLWSGFDRIKRAHFSRKRRSVFRYGLSIHQIAGAPLVSGETRRLPGSDFVISLGSYNQRGKDINVGGVPYQAGTFMHEFGHTLGLDHGGGDGVNYKPNYLSVMNYAWQFSGLSRANGSSGLYDYSRYGARSPAGTLAALNENSLSERDGLRATGNARTLKASRHCGSRLMLMRLNAPADWNCNGVISRGRVRAEINNDRAKQTLRPFDDWANLSYVGGSVGVPGAGAAPFQRTTASRPGPREATIRQLHHNAQVATDDFIAPTVRILGKRRVRMPRAALLRVVARDNKQVTDLEVLVDGRTRSLTSLDRPHRELVLQLRFRRGRHTILAYAFDGAGTISRIVSASVVVR